MVFCWTISPIGQSHMADMEIMHVNSMMFSFKIAKSLKNEIQITVTYIHSEFIATPYLQTAIA